LTQVNSTTQFVPHCCQGGGSTTTSGSPLGRRIKEIMSAINIVLAFSNKYEHTHLYESIPKEKSLGAEYTA
jgi:hypothetical protein